ncbi:transcription antitermination factor NusB [Lichenihabitans psoromatis]|uniref:transcription antitermination factor NusB n=2 Tax=Lichenihabitans psoromatis TaxID=2528642 RepID=UPI001036C8A6|nr:transcription antitermination factor NusB [Lichenihabitans psoromatis]
MARGEQRAAARLAAVQALYQMEVARKGLNEIFAEFESHWIGQEVEGDQYRPAEIAFFRNILQGVLDHQTAIDKMTDEALQAGWPLRRVEAVLRAILRCGTYELMRRGDVPARVVITEYADLAAAFFDREEVGLVNGVLDGLAHTLRSDEFEPRRQTPA